MERLVRQEALNLTVPTGVAVIGCGGVGSWTGYLLALAGVSNLYLFDPDTVSVSNLNRTPYGEDQLDILKSSALASLIHDRLPETKVAAFQRFTPEMADGMQLDTLIGYLVVTTDTWESRRSAKQWADAHNVRYMEAAAEGDFGSATDSPADFATVDETNPGYRSVPVWAGPVIIAATLACQQILHAAPLNGKAVRMGWKETPQFFYR